MPRQLTPIEIKSLLTYLLTYIRYIHCLHDVPVYTYLHVHHIYTNVRCTFSL
jgi:hypothetical protein